MYRSLVLLFLMLPQLLSGQTTMPLSSSVTARNQAPPQGSQSAPAAVPTPAATPANATRPDRPAATQITLEQAIDLALKNSPTIKAARTQIQQNEALEVTANLRPNPVLSVDSQFVPVFTADFSADTINNLQQFDIGVGYLFERGHKRQNRLQAAKDTDRCHRSHSSRH